MQCIEEQMEGITDINEYGSMYFRICLYFGFWTPSPESICLLAESGQRLMVQRLKMQIFQMFYLLTNKIKMGRNNFFSSYLTSKPSHFGFDSFILWNGAIQLHQSQCWKPIVWFSLKSHITGLHFVVWMGSLLPIVCQNTSGKLWRLLAVELFT